MFVDFGLINTRKMSENEEMPQSIAGDVEEKVYNASLPDDDIEDESTSDESDPLEPISLPGPKIDGGGLKQSILQVG